MTDSGLEVVVMHEGYKKLKIWHLSHELGIRVHKMSLNLPKFEIFEEGGQIRRSSKSLSSNIGEGYGLRYYKEEYIHYLIRSYASSLETIEHLEYLHETDSLKDENMFNELVQSYQESNKMLFKFIESVKKQHETNIFEK